MDAFVKIKWLYFARLTSLMGSQILFFAIPLLIFRLTNNVVYSGLAFSLEWFARLVSFPLSGYCADRFGSKRVYFLTDLTISILCIFSILLIIFFPHLSIAVIMLLSVIAGFLSEQGYVSAESLAPKLIESKYYPKSQSILELFELLSLLCGPCLAGIFVLYFKLENLIYVAAIFYFLSAIFIKGVEAKDYIVKTDAHLINNLSIGFKTILNNPYLMQLVLVAMLINMLIGLVIGSAPIIVASIYHKTDHFYAILNLSAGICGTGMIILFNYMVTFLSITKIGIYTFFLVCLSCILLGFTHSYIAYLFIFAFFYGVSGLFSIFFRSERVRIIPTEILGRTIGTIIFITFLLFPLSGILISISQKFLGLQNLVMLFGVLCLLLGMPILNKIYHTDEKYKGKLHEIY